MTTNRTPDEYQFTLTIESRTPISNLDVLSSLEIDFDDADSISCDPVVKESLTVDTAYREGFEACRNLCSDIASRIDGDQLYRPGAKANLIYEAIRALPTPTTKGGA